MVDCIVHPQDQSYLACVILDLGGLKKIDCGKEGLLLKNSESREGNVIFTKSRTI